MLVNDQRTNSNARSWCRRAQELGMNVPEIAARALDRPVDEVRAELARMAQGVSQ